MNCAQCGTPYSPGDKFCEQCGAALTAPAEGEENIGATLVGAPPQSAILARSDDPNHSYPLGNRVVVGRLDTCDIPIHDKSVSREHARLSQLPGGYVVEDLGSTNGTMVNGQRIQDAVILRPSDTVTFGSVEFVFQEEVPAAAAAETPAMASTQPFRYEPGTVPPEEETPAPAPPPWVQPAAPEPATPAPASHDTIQEPAPALDFPPLQPFAPTAEEEPAPPPQPAIEPAPAPEEAPAAAAPEIMAPQPVKEPVVAASTPPSDNSTSELADEVVAVAARLSDLAQLFGQKLGALDSERAELQGRVQEVEQNAAALNQTRDAVRSVPPSPMTGEELENMREILTQLSQNPRDIELLMRVGQQASQLATLVTEYDQLRQLLDNLASTVGAA